MATSEIKYSCISNRKRMKRSEKENRGLHDIGPPALDGVLSMFLLVLKLAMECSQNLMIRIMQLRCFLALTVSITNIFSD